MAPPDDTEPSRVRSWAACALLVLGAAWLVVGLLDMPNPATTSSLAAAVAPAVGLIAAGAVLLR